MEREGEGKWENEGRDEGEGKVTWRGLHCTVKRPIQPPEPEQPQYSSL